MTGITGITNSYSGLSNGYAASEAATLTNEMNTFQSLIDAVQQGNMVKSDTQSYADIATSIPLAKDDRLNGDYLSGFGDTFVRENDKKAVPIGAAANANTAVTDGKTIDKTSRLYEQSLELESYFVKIMLSSMRNTLTGASLSGEEKSYAQKMYDDMFYDELAVNMTKNAGFGLADQIYLQLNA